MVLCLREAGFEVEYIQETTPGRPDQQILARPDIGSFILITGDKGFGDWIFNKGLGRPSAILLRRLPHSEWAATAERIIDLLVRGVGQGQIITITRDGARTRQFPTGV